MNLWDRRPVTQAENGEIDGPEKHQRSRELTVEIQSVRGLRLAQYLFGIPKGRLTGLQCSFVAPSLSDTSAARRASDFASSSLRCSYQNRAHNTIARPSRYGSFTACEESSSNSSYLKNNSDNV